MRGRTRERRSSALPPPTRAWFLRLHRLGAQGLPGRAYRVQVASCLNPPSKVLGAQCEELDHQVKIISPQYVKPFVRRQKNDGNDAEAICTAARQARAPARANQPRSTWASHLPRRLGWSRPATVLQRRSQGADGHLEAREPTPAQSARPWRPRGRANGAPQDRSQQPVGQPASGAARLQPPTLAIPPDWPKVAVWSAA